MRAIPAFGHRLCRSLLLQPKTSHLRCTPCRRGSQRTLSTPYYDPQDFTRDRTTTIHRSLYEHPEDYTDEAEYPAIEPIKKTPAWVRFTREKQGRELARKPLQEKMMYFRFAPRDKNVHEAQEKWEHRRRFWKPFEIRGYPDIYHLTPMYQYLTKTAIVSDELPADYYAYLGDAELTAILDKIREPVRAAILAESEFFAHNTEAVSSDADMVVQAQSVIDATTRAIDLAVARSDYPHLHELQRDLETKCAAFWKRSGFRDEEQHEFTLDRDGMEMKLQYVEDGHVFRLFRHEQPLPPVVPRISSLVNPSILPAPVEDSALATQPTATEPESTVIDVPLENFCPSTRGFEDKQYLPHWIPGFWFGDPCEFSTLSLTVPRNFAAVADRLGEEAAFENLAASAIIGGFGRVVAQAMYLGFTILNELTYPIVTQSIFTNGRDWVFSTYQGNTIALWKQDSDNPLRNLAWITKPMALFEHVEDGQVVGLNDEVLKHIVRQYLKAPSAAHGLNLRPYIGEPAPITSYWKEEGRSRVPFYHRQERADGKPRQPYKPEI
ncbi:putative 28S ribosomal protein S30, mitochondrial [Hypsibius exemplaris]|uniref:28S ribosomal protein S30, mitochondrial n=1 Tax=Hypsibius exemplaris TaxID=2072580 RepID=A0A9X6NET7_HYPEX|nr:putative 28S ribosomal protein S30, mitochondrial [Hypsibius exemplaris]